MTEVEKFNKHSEFIKGKFKEIYPEVNIGKTVIKCCFLDESYKNTVVNGSPSFGVRINMTDEFKSSMMSLVSELNDSGCRSENLLIGLFNPFDNISDFTSDTEFINNEIKYYLSSKFPNIYVYDENNNFAKI